ncbi:MAG: WYL domain-containing protein [Deltaproteobacteria bacterium]|jgi:predicted DNA-binding transcriptional regulator YafY|nr:WYL domain-containing protein [Deltaproteobacteria bacterium]
MPKKWTDATATHKTLLLFTRLLFFGRRLWLTELAKQFECSKATIMRMMETIEVSGVAKIETDIERSGRARGRRWYQLRILPGTPHIGLTRDEVEKLSFCRDLLQRLLPDGIERVIDEGIAKVSTLMEHAEERGEATLPKATRVSWGRIDYTPFQARMETLLGAISSHTVCAVEYRELEYKFPDSALQRYEFVPLRLTAEYENLNAEGWLVTGKGKLEIKHPLTLAIHRICSCVPTRRVLEDCPPLPEHQVAFGLVGYEAFPVRVVFDEVFSGYIQERIWSDDQEIVALPDGRVELRFRAADRNELIGWVFSFGNGATLLEPEGLRRQIREELEDMLDMYAGEDDGE